MVRLTAWIWKLIPKTRWCISKQEISSVKLESVQCNFFSFDHVTFIQFKICCCVQDFMKIRWLFTEIWRYIDFQNGGRPPSWNCCTTIRDYPRSLCCWPQLPVNDTQIWRYSYLNFFAYLAWNAYAGPQNGGFGGLWTPKCDYSSSRPPKGTSLRKSASFKLSTVKIRWGVWPVGELTESVTDTQTTDRHTQANLYSVHAQHWTDK